MNPQLSPSLGLTKREVANYRIGRLIMAAANGRAAQEAAFEVGCSDALRERLGLRAERFSSYLIPGEILSRDLTAAVAPAGGYLVANETGDLVPALRARSWAFQLPRQMPGQRSNFTLPRHGSNVSVTWLADENASITETTPTLGSVAFTPKAVAVLVERSALHVKQVTEANDALIGAELVGAAAQAVDLAGVQGTGANGQPTGVLNTSGVGTQSGTSLAWSGVVAMLQSVETASADAAGGVAWLVAPDVAKILRGRERSAGSGFILAEGPGGDTIAGRPALVTTAVPAGALVLGCWPHAVLPQWGALELVVTPFGSATNFKTGIVSMRVILNVDFGLTHAAAFSISTSIT